jgi:hypothetical protein
MHVVAGERERGEGKNEGKGFEDVRERDLIWCLVFI